MAQGQPPPQVIPEAQYPPLQEVFQRADQIVQAYIGFVLNTANRDIILPACEAPGDAVAKNEWIPFVFATVDAELDKMINEVYKELPQMVFDAIDKALGPAGITVLQQLARNEYTCALPCNCPAGCTGALSEEEEDQGGDEDEEEGMCALPS